MSFEDVVSRSRDWYQELLGKIVRRSNIELAQHYEGINWGEYSVSEENSCYTSDVFDGYMVMGKLRESPYHQQQVGDESDSGIMFLSL